MELDKIIIREIKESSLSEIIDLFVNQYELLRKFIQNPNKDDDDDYYSCCPKSNIKLFKELSSKLFTHYFTVINYMITNNINLRDIDEKYYYHYHNWDSFSSLFFFDESSPLVFDNYNFENKVKLLKLIAPYKNTMDGILNIFFKNRRHTDIVVIDRDIKKLLKILKIHIENGVNKINNCNYHQLISIGIDINKIINNDFQQKVIHVVLGAKGSLPFHLANNIYAYLRVN